MNLKLTNDCSVLPVLFKLFRCPDKVLRKTLSNHIISDIAKLNEKSNNVHVNKTIQNFMYSMLQVTIRSEHDC